MFPIEVCEQTGPQADSLKKLLYLPADLFWFKGHFPQQAVLPGIAQINWALFYASRLVGKAYEFYGIDQVKFQKPLQPDQTIQLRLLWDTQRCMLVFHYELCGQGQLQNWPLQEPCAASSGKIKFHAR